MKRVIAVSLASTLATLSWSLLVLRSGPWALDSAAVIAASLIVLLAIGLVGMLVASSRWGRWMVTGVTVLGPVFGVGVPANAWWIATLVVSGLALTALAGTVTSGLVRKLPAADGPTPRVVGFTLALLALPLMVATVSPEGLGTPEWLMIAVASLAAGLYAKAAPFAMVVVRGVVPVLALVAMALSGLPRGLLWSAMGLAVAAFAWTKEARVAVRPLVEEGRSVPMLPEMVPSDILEAAGLDERGRPRSQS